MLIWRFFHGGPTNWVCKITNGSIRKQGLGISFYYLPDRTTVVSVPTGVVNTDFHFEERSSDYQTVHVQGILTWRIVQPEKAAQLLNFSVNAAGQHLSEDPQKLEEKLQNLVAVLGRRTLKALRLEEALKAADTLGDALRAAFKEEPYLQSLGIEAISVELLAIKPEPEVGRALESATRELLLKQSDDATAQRRLSALENERVLNEREAGNELAKEKAARAVAETRENHARLEQQHAIQMAEQKQQADLARRAREVETVQTEKLGETRTEASRNQIAMQGALELAGQEKQLAEARLEVARKDAEAEKARTEVLFGALKSLSAEQLQSLALMGAQPGASIANAFQRLAERAGTIGQLNISPDLLQSLLQQPQPSAPAARGQRGA
jgi:hypothetical protein